MKCLLAAVNAKYIHSNPGVYSLKTYAESMAGGPCAAEESGESGGLCSEEQGLSPVTVGNRELTIEIGEYTINHQMDQILEDIFRKKPDIVGFSCYIWNIVPVLDLVRDLHKVLPDTDIWLGGPEVSFDAPRLLVQEPDVLGVMKGEGEESFAGLMACYRRFGSTVRRELANQDEGRQAGWVFDDSAQCAAAPLDTFIEEVAQMPGITLRTPDGTIADQPVRPVMDMSRIPFLYQTMDDFEHRIVYYESSRGCPFSCSYCLSSIDKSVRFRDLELVKKELSFFLERKVPQVKFVDRTFNCKKSHAMEIWRYILEHDNGVTNFHFEIAADLLDEEELELIGRMRPGLIQLEIGVQSTNPDTIREIRRKMDLSQVRAVVERLRAGNNVHQHLDLIAGLPFEDYQSFQNSFNEVYEMRPEQLQLGFLKVLKGSFMYEKAADYGLTCRAQPPYEVLSTRWLPYSDVLRLKGIEEMVEVYYNSGQFVSILGLLEPAFAHPFALFEALAAYYQEKQLTGRSHSRLARYEILHDFIAERLPDMDISAAEDCLMIDLYLRENIKSRPSFAPDPFRDKERIRRCVPELRSLGAKLHGEILQSGELLVFDYRIRDPLTNNARVTRWGEPLAARHTKEDANGKT